jgi:hypothetical protein
MADFGNVGLPAPGQGKIVEVQGGEIALQRVARTLRSTTCARMRKRPWPTVRSPSLR